MLLFKDDGKYFGFDSDYLSGSVLFNYTNDKAKCSDDVRFD